MTDPSSRVLALVRQQAAARSRILAALIAVLQAHVGGFGDWYDESAARAAAARWAAISGQAQRQVALSTASYLTLAAHQYVPAPRPRVEVPADIRGVPAADVYVRPVAEYRRLLADPVFVAANNAPASVATADRAQTILDRPAPGARLDLVEAERILAGDTAGATLNFAPTPASSSTAPAGGASLDLGTPAARSSSAAGGATLDFAPPPARPVVDDPPQAAARRRAVERLAVIAETDTDLAMRAATVQTLARIPEVRGYRRVIHPELSAGGTCGLCIVASDRVYHVEELMPIHGRCKCETLPIIGQHDPGRSLNEADLGRLYEAAGSTAAAALAATRYQVDEHGELGPVLNRHGHAFRDPNQVAADRDPARPAPVDLNA